MESGIYCTEGQSPKLTIISPEGTEEIVFNTAPIYINIVPLTNYCIVFGGQSPASQPPIVSWQMFFDYSWEDFENNIRPEGDQPQDDDTYLELYFKGQFFARAPYPGANSGFQVLEYENEYLQLLNDSSIENHGGSCSFSTARIGVSVVELNTGSSIYDERLFLTPCEILLDCGGQCPDGSFAVGDDSTQGYRCLPYENLMNWAKTQRQILRKV